MNCYLTANNEAEVMELIKSSKIKSQWQALKEQFGKLLADSKIAKMHGYPMKTVVAARYYW